MLNLSVMAATAMLGLGAGVHCVAMCGPASTAVARTPADAAWFHLGRFIGYGALGGLASAGAVGMSHLAGVAAWLHPIWLLSHVLLAVMGGWMLVTGRHPRWVQDGLLRAARGVLRTRCRLGDANMAYAQRVAVTGSGSSLEVRMPVAALARSTTPGKPPGSSAFLVGVAWALWPCGILYSAIAIAWLTQDVLGGTVAMMAFAAGSGVQLWLGQRGLIALMRAGKESLGIRIAGALTCSVALALIMWVAMGNLPSDFCLPGS